MEQMTLLVLLALCCWASVANNIKPQAWKTTDGEKTKEAIRLWLFYGPMQSMLTEPMLSETELKNGKQLMDRVRITKPEFVTGLIYNSTVSKTMVRSHAFA
uniref:Uncharacterized protein n=1 Tax=Romanomermis culicivorax TaxID=13658 RepID=A0A915L9X5_ROMCU